MIPTPFAPPQPGAIVTAHGAELGEARLDKRPADRCCGDSRLKRHHRLPGALPFEMQLARTNIHHTAWRREPALIDPAPDHLVDHACDQQAGQNEQQ
jgi:hypothetical protein